MDTLVSVIIPTYNRCDTLNRAIDSVLNQTYKNLELIIVDDGSTDGTYESVNERYQDAENIIYIQNDKNMGQSEARNLGVQQAHGEYVAFCDSDDEWKPYKLEKQMEVALKADEDVGLIYSAFVWDWQNGMLGEWPPKDWNIEQKQGDVLEWLLLHPLVGIITALMKREVYVSLGGFNTELKAFEDYEFTIRIAREYKFAFVDEVLATAFVSKESVGKHENEKLFAQCYMMVAYREELERYNLKKEKFLSVMSNAAKSGSEKILLQLLISSSQDWDYAEYAREYFATFNE